MILNNDLQIKTDMYDGPLGLLLLLIQKEDLDIKNLDISYITRQYLDYLKKIETLNFDLAGDFLYMAATLTLIKSQSCLSLVPQKSEEENPYVKIETKEELARRLQILHEFQKLGQSFQEIPGILGQDEFKRPALPKNRTLGQTIAPMEMNSLINTMLDLMKREKRKITIIQKDPISIRQKLTFLKKHLKDQSIINFWELVKKDEISERHHLLNIVMTFISLLELARLGKIELVQSEESPELYLKVLEPLENFDLEMANEFDSINEHNETAPQQTDLVQ